jgi:hypothetical protein
MEFKQRCYDKANNNTELQHMAKVHLQPCVRWIKLSDSYFTAYINYVLHHPNAHIYLKNIKIFYKMLDKKPQNMFRLIDKPSSGGVTTACL